MGKKLLVADDSVTIQKVIKLALSSEGYEITVASGGHEVVQAIQSEKPDIVLIDITLPDMNAYDVKRAVNQVAGLEGVRFVLMYSAFEKVDEKQAESLGFHGRLIKPFDPSNLRKLISDLLSKPAVTKPTTKEAVEEPALAPVYSLDFPPIQDEHPILDAQILPHVRTHELSLDLPLPEQEDHTGSRTIDIPLFPQEERTLSTTLHQPVRHRDVEPVSPPPAPTNAAVQAPYREADIRTLTDSTMQLTGFDTGGWSIDESRKLRSESPSKLINIPSKPVDDGGSSFLSDADSPQIEQIQIPKPQILTPQASTPSVSSLRAPVRDSASGLEAAIRKDLEKTLQPTLEKIIRETLPAIAEAMIKREIDRILSER